MTRDPLPIRAATGRERRTRDGPGLPPAGLRPGPSFALSSDLDGLWGRTTVDPGVVGHTPRLVEPGRPLCGDDLAEQ